MSLRAIGELSCSSRDIAERLQDVINELPHEIGNGAIASLFREARNEIVRLRSVAGAVTPGPSFSDIRAMGHDSVGRPHPILKAFDGA
jgi:hypothetical protein